MSNLIRKSHHKRLKRGDKELTRTRFRIRRIRKCIGSRKPTPGSRQALDRSLKSVNARHVKLRDGFKCCQCRAKGRETTEVLDAGHLFPSEKYPAVMYDTDNIFAQCRAHNSLHISEPEHFHEWHIAEVGQAAHDELEARASGRALTLEEMTALLPIRTNEFKETLLLAEAGV